MSRKNQQKNYKSFFIAFFVVLSVVVLIVLKFPRKAEAAWYSDYWHFRKKLVIDNTKVSGSTDLTDFPVLVSISADTDISSHAQSDGDDIVFTDINGQKLDHEIESYSSGTLTAWVRVPKVYATENTAFYIYYGNPTATNQQNKKGVWKNYAAVWHLNEDQSGTGNLDLYQDSTGNGWHGDDYVSSTTKTGVILNGQDFDGTDDYITMGNITSILSKSKLTMTAWMKRDASNAYNFVGKQKPTSYDNNIFLEYYSDGKMYYDMSNSGNGFGDVTNNNTSWHYISMVFDGTQTGNSNRLKGYIDGAAQTLGFTGTVPSTTTSDTTSFEIGRDPGPTYQSSPVDEVRVYLGTLSADWIATEYNNQNSPSTFFTTGTQEKGTSPTLYLKMDEGIDNTCSNGTNDTCDSSSNGNDGAISNGAQWKTAEECVSNSCLFFDGSDDIVTVNTNNTIDLSDNLASAFTIQGWVKVNSDGENDVGQILYKGTNTYIRTALEGTDGYADLDVKVDLATTDADLSLTMAIKLNTWQHIAVVYTDDADDEITVYINGINQGSSLNGVGAPASDANNLLLGGSSSANYHGYLDEFKFYDYARTAAQIKTDAIKDSAGNAGTSSNLGQSNNYVNSNGLLGYWKLDGNTNDSAGNSYTLTNNSSTTFVGAKYGTGSEHVPASSQYLSTTTTIYAIRSVSFWVNPDSTTNYYLSLTSSAYIESSSGTLSATGFSNAKIYVNGVETTTIAADKWQLVTVTTDTPIDANTFYIGRVSSNYFDGTMDEVRVYSETLTPNNINDLYSWAPEPVVYWDLNENKGTSSVNDKSGNSNTGAMTGTMTSTDWVTGKYSSALDFDGADDSLVIATASDASVDFNSTETFSAGAWVYIKTMPGSGNQDAIITKWDQTSTIRGYRLYVENDDADTTGNFQIDLYDESTDQTISATKANDTALQNTWYHVEFTFNGGTAGTAGDLKLYVNGTLADSNTANASFLGLEDIAADFTVGDYDTTDVVANNTAFTGIIDDIRVYNYTRSSQQVIEDMNSGHPAPGSPIGSGIAYWNFEYTSSGTCGKDASINAKDLTCTSVTSNGKIGTAFQGSTTARATLSDDNDFDFAAADSLAISMWFKRGTVSGTEYLLVKTSGTAGYALYLNSTGQLVFGIGDQASASFPEDTITTTAEYDDSSWHHVVATKDATNFIKIFVDGNEVASDTTLAADATLANSGTLYIGDTNGTNSTNEFQGVIDEVKMYRFSIDENQARVLYNNLAASNFGSSSTDASGNVDNSRARIYCIPGDTTSCDAAIAHYKFDENTGQRLENTSLTTAGTSGNQMNLGGSTSASTDDPAFIPGVSGSALDFDGSADFARTSDDSDLDFTDTDDFTIEAWFNRDTFTTDDVIVSKRANYASNRPGYVIWIDDANDDINFEISDGGGTVNDEVLIDSSTTFTATGWHHVAVVIDQDSNTNSTVYIDGIPDKQALTGDLANIGTLENTAEAFIGKIGAQDYFDGKIDNVMFYKYARTPAQIQWDYNKGKAALYYKFDECQGSTINNTNNTSLSGTWTGASGGNTTAGTCSSGTSTEAWNNGTTGHINASLDFDGSDDIVTVTNASRIDFDQGLLYGVNFSFWVYANSDGEADTGQVFYKGTNTYCRTDSQSGSNLDLECSLDLATTDATLNISSGLTTNAWHHVSIGYTDDNDDEITIYIDGKNKGSSSNGSGAPASSDTNNLIIGGNTTANFDGQLDEFKIYQYELTGDQVLVDFNGGVAKFN